MQKISRLVSSVSALAVALPLHVGTSANAADAPPSPIRRVSVSASGAEANGWEPALSADGRFIAFTSNAVALGATSAASQVFRKNLLSHEVEAISVNDAGGIGNAGSSQAAVSADGRYVAFTSHASNLVAGDSNGVADIFVRDLQLRVTSRVSVSSQGVQGDRESGWPSISAKGDRVAFTSAAGNLAPETHLWPGTSNVFLRDLPSKVTRKASVNSYGNNGVYGFPQNSFMTARAGTHALSADGRYLVFRGSTLGGALASAPCTGTYEYIRPYLYDWDAGIDVAAPARASVPALATPEAFGCNALPSISADGSTVAFRGDAETMTVTYPTVTGPTIPRSIPVPNVWSGTSLPPPTASTGELALSSTGSHVVLTVAIEQAAPRQVLGQTFAIEISTGQSKLISTTPSGEASGPPADDRAWKDVSAPSVDGAVAFASAASDLVAPVADGLLLRGDTNAAVDIFLAEAAVPSAAPQTGGDYVALGDSFASGEGAAEATFLPGTSAPDPLLNREATTGCHRSSTSWAYHVKEAVQNMPEPLLGFRFVACSGGVADNLYGTNTRYKDSTGTVEAPQLTAVTRDTRLVTLSMGGNDVGFVPIVENCVSYFGSPGGYGCSAPGTFSYTRAQQGLRMLRRGLDTGSRAHEGGPTKTALVDVYTDIASRMNDQGVIAITGYPKLFDERRSRYTTRARGASRFNRFCELGSVRGTVPIRVRYDDALWMNAIVKQANLTIEDSVRNANDHLASSGAKVRVVFVDVDQEFKNNRLCSGERWFNGVELAYPVPDPRKARPKQVSLHPNLEGQRAYAAAVLRDLRSESVIP